ncbi:MAG: phosphoenolpyruvate--protein phosphotransferase [Planctomycetes bacterium]|jgi:phosphoenolpyruvate-protein phosphotransferase|nr:phosphoenolpyruvate--protein phosphotransferase [Planctomycetota bacterium]
MTTLRGVPIAPGRSVGRAFVCDGASGPAADRRELAGNEVEAEIERLHEAVAAADAELQDVLRRLEDRGDRNTAEILTAHRRLLGDQSFLDDVKRRISDDLENAEHAVEQVTRRFSDELAEVDDAYLSQRSADIRDVGQRIVRRLAGDQTSSLRDLPRGAILVADELLPSLTLHLDRGDVAGLITERGGATSHAAIMARALGIPAVTGVDGARRAIRNGDLVVLDADAGAVRLLDVLEVDETRPAAEALKRVGEDADEVQDEDARRAHGCATCDGTAITIFANIGRRDEARLVNRFGLDGVGLFRTEYLYLDHSEAPTIDKEIRAYRAAIEAIGDRPLVIRTLDLGGDKHPTFLQPADGHNPNLGLRGLRYSLQERQMFTTQLRALVRVADSHDVRILLPMVLAGDDLGEAIEIIDQIVRSEGLQQRPPVGAMIETPSAVFAIDDILEQADFVSIGTNDLVQFMLAADRDAAAMIGAASVLHPSVLRAIRQVVQAAASRSVPVSVCGEAAGDPTIAPLLVGLGVRQLSMSPLRSPAVRNALGRHTINQLNEMADNSPDQRSAEAVREIVGQLPDGHQVR